MRRIRRILVGAALAATGLAAVAAGQSHATASPPPFVKGAAGADCTGGPPPQWLHVVVVVMENHGYSQVIGHSPYVDALATACGLATSYHGVSYPSLPNYLAMTGGSTFGVRDDGSPSVHPINAPSIFGQVDSRSLEEGMRGNCSSSGGNLYAVKHNPQAYYTPIHNQCLQRNVPLGSSPDLSAAYTFITPNLCHDTHNCPLSAGDSFLSGFVPALMRTPQYQAGNTAIFVTWDTDNRHEGNHVATLVVAPSVRPGTKDATAYNHYSLLKTVEQMLGVPELGAAAGATSMRGGMHL
ncbi:MAG: alkaline phosphatase family protein [Nocardioidaceae bacterium]